MIDIDNAISNLEIDIRWICDHTAHQFPGWGNAVMAMRDALELLKEQPAIVRCKDCIHRPTWNRNIIEFPDCICPCWSEDNHDRWIPEDDWFCADGERRENDV